MVRRIFLTIPLVLGNFYDNDFDTANTNEPEPKAETEHDITFQRGLSYDIMASISNKIHEAEFLEATRDMTNFVTMAFWAVVLESINPDTGKLYESIHEIPLEESTNFWREQFTHYGCYCWPDGQERISGFGPPQDPLDEQCHDLWQCYRCINRDPACAHVDWVHDHYDCEFLKSSDNTTLTIDCTDPLSPSANVISNSLPMPRQPTRPLRTRVYLGIKTRHLQASLSHMPMVNSILTHAHHQAINTTLKKVVAGIGQQ